MFQYVAGDRGHCAERAVDLRYADPQRGTARPLVAEGTDHARAAGAVALLITAIAILSTGAGAAEEVVESGVTTLDRRGTLYWGSGGLCLGRGLWPVGGGPAAGRGSQSPRGGDLVRGQWCRGAQPGLWSVAGWE